MKRNKIKIKLKTKQEENHKSVEIIGGGSLFPRSTLAWLINKDFQASRDAFCFTVLKHLNPFLLIS